MTGRTLIDDQCLTGAFLGDDIWGLAFQPVAGGGINATQTVVEGAERCFNAFHVQGEFWGNFRTLPIQGGVDCRFHIQVRAGLGRGEGQRIIPQGNDHIFLLIDVI